jgi:hypothetical protein
VQHREADRDQTDRRRVAQAGGADRQDGDPELDPAEQVGEPAAAVTIP